MKALLIIATTLFQLGIASAAQPFFCVVGKGEAQPKFQASVFIAEPQLLISDSIQNDELLWQAGLRDLQCQDLKNVSTGIQALSITLAATGFGLACTGVGAKVGLVLGGISIGLDFVDLVVGNLPCKQTDDRAKIELEMRKFVCAQLALNGATCDPLIPRM